MKELTTLLETAVLNSRSQLRDPRTRALILVVVLIACLLGSVFWTLERTKYLLAARLEEGGNVFEALKVFWGALGYLDVVLVAIGVGCVSMLLVLELRTNALSQGLLHASRRSYALLTTVLMVWFAHSYLHPGYLLGGDMAFHVARIEHFRLGLEQGQILFWDNFFNIGVPFLQFTGPLVHWVGGTLAVIVNDSYLATKMLLFALHVAAGCAVYRLLRDRQLDRLASLIGASVYSGAWAHLQLFHYKGVVPQAFIILFLPLGFLLLDRVAARGSTRVWPVLALVGGLALIAHPSNGIFTGFLLALFVGINLAAGRHQWRSLVPVTLAGTFGVLLAAFIILPILVEGKWVTMTETSRLIALIVPDASFLKTMLTWRNTNTGSGADFEGYIGISTALLALIGIYATWRRSVTRWDRKFFCIASIFLPLAVILTGPHVRNIIFILFFASLLAALGTQHLITATRGWRHLPAAIIVAVFVDLGSTSIQPLARSDKAYLDTVREYLSQNATGTRTLQAISHSGRLEIPIWGGGPMLTFPIQQLGLPYGYSATVFHNYGAAIVKTAEDELRQEGRLRKSTEQWLALLNVRRIVNDHGSGMGMPQSVVSGYSEGPLGQVVHVPGASPAILAKTLARRVPDSKLDKPVVWDADFEAPATPRAEALKDYVVNLLDEMDFDPASGTARFIPVRVIPTTMDTTSRVPSDPWKYRIIKYQVDFSRIAITLESDRAGYMQLAHAWYPFLTVTRDGVQIQPVQGTLNFLVLPIHTGQNVYEIVPFRSGLRKTTGLISVSAFVLLLALALRPSRQSN